MARNPERVWIISHTAGCDNNFCQNRGVCHYAASLYGPKNIGQLSSTLPEGDEGVESYIFDAGCMLQAATRHDNNGCPNTRKIVREIFAWANSMGLPKDKL